MSGFFGGLFEVILGLAGLVLFIVTMGVIGIDMVLVNFWVVVDKLLASISLWPAPLSWAVISGTLGFLVHLGCSRERR